MKRSPFVLMGTVAGLAGVLTFHSSPAKLTLGTLPTGGGTTPTTVAKGGGPTTIPSGVHTATGPLVNYYFGDLSVNVTVNGSKITNVAIGTLSDGGNYRSQSIDQQSVPMLEQQAMQAQSANIQGVSGASYTSAGFQASLQGALTKLGL